MHQRLHAQQHDVVGSNGALFKAAPLAANSSFGQLSGPVKGLTVMVQFPDQTGTITQTQVSNFLNSTNYSEFGNAQSVRGYYQSASNNKVDYTNVVPRYYTAKRNKAYYTDPSVAERVRAQELIAEALAWLQTSEKFDFSTLTTDANRKIRDLNFLHRRTRYRLAAAGLSAKAVLRQQCLRQRLPNHRQRCHRLWCGNLTRACDRVRFPGQAYSEHIPSLSQATACQSGQIFYGAPHTIR